MTWKSESFQTIALPTGGARRWRCSSIQALRSSGDSFAMATLRSGGAVRLVGSYCYRAMPNSKDRAAGPPARPLSVIDGLVAGAGRAAGARATRARSPWFVVGRPPKVPPAAGPGLGRSRPGALRESAGDSDD